MVIQDQSDGLRQEDQFQARQNWRAISEANGNPRQTLRQWPDEEPASSLPSASPLPSMDLEADRQHPDRLQAVVGVDRFPGARRYGFPARPPRALELCGEQSEFAEEAV